MGAGGLTAFFSGFGAAGVAGFTCTLAFGATEDFAAEGLGVEDLGVEDLGAEDLGAEVLATEDLGANDLAAPALRDLAFFCAFFLPVALLARAGFAFAAFFFAARVFEPAFLAELLPRFAGKVFFAFCFFRAFFFFRTAITCSFVSSGAFADDQRSLVSIALMAMRIRMDMSCITLGGEVAAGRQ